MNNFKEGVSVKSVHVYGPADTDYSDKYCDMTIVMENGQMARVPYVRAVHRATGEVTMINCAQCVCINLGAPDHRGHDS